MNPSAKAQEQRQQEVEHLKEENERLMARVQLLEQAGGPVEDLTLQVNKQLESVPESKAIEGMVVFFKQYTESLCVFHWAQPYSFSQIVQLTGSWAF